MIDDQSVSLTGGDLRSLLASARDYLGPKGLVVVEVKLDGQPLVGDELDSDTPTDFTQSDVRMYSAKPSSLVIGILEEVREQLGIAGQMQEQAAELFQKDEPGDAMGLLRESIDGWIQAQQAVLSSSQLLDLDLALIKVDDQSVVTRMQELIKSLMELKELVGANDMVALADALAYEWPEATRRWDEAIGAVIKHIEAAC